jgi:hypothetical protein
MKTSFGGFPPKEGYSLLDPSTVSWFSVPLEECLAD